jgi:putative transposase
MLINKTCKVRIYPNQAQERSLGEILIGCDFVWNYFLNKRKDYYLEHKETIPYAQMSLELTRMRRTTPEIALIQAHPLQQSLRRLDKAYNAFFRKENQFPKFKIEEDRTHSFYKSKDWHIEGNKISLQKDLCILFRGRIDTKGDIGGITISRKESGRWYATIVVKIEVKPKNKFTAPIGIDLGISTLATTDKGKKFAPNPLDQTLRTRVKQLQRELMRRKEGSNRYLETKRELAKVQEKIADKRANYLHHTSHQIVNKRPSLIVMEDLAVKKMKGGRTFNRNKANASMRELGRQIEYKQKWNGGEFTKIDRYFPSSKTCSGCFYVMESLPLSIRQWECPSCGKAHDRDINAAKMILRQATK